MKVSSILALAPLLTFAEEKANPTRALRAIKSHYFQEAGRNLVSTECVESQNSIEESGINEAFAAISGDESELPVYCDLYMSEGGLTQYCDFNDSDMSIDRTQCSELGGTVTVLSLQTVCADALMTLKLESLTLCLSNDCSEADFEQELETGINEAFEEDEGLICDSDVQFSPYYISAGSRTISYSARALGVGLLFSFFL